MDRLRPLDPPHKGIRNAFSQVSLLSGRTDFADPEQVRQLQAAAAELFTILRDHKNQEDTFIFSPLDQRVTGATDDERAQHVLLHAEHDALESTLASFDGTQTNDEGHSFVLGLSGFHGRYLIHMESEEAHAEPLLLEHVTDEEMAADQGAIMAQMPFETLLLWFKYIVPARRIADNRQVLAGFTSAAPPEAVAAAMEVLASVETPERLKAMTENL